MTARLTNLNYREKPALHTTVDLGIPVDKINMKPELYNPDPDSNPILDELDELLFGEGKVAPAYIPKNQDKSRKLHKLESYADIPEEIPETNHMIAKYGIDILDELVDVQEMSENLTAKIERGFDFTKSHKIHDHPTRPGVVAVKTWYILPHFDQIDKKLVHLVNPEDAVNTAKHCMVPGNQKGQRVLQEFVKTSETNTNNTGIDNELDPHKMHTFEYTQDYLFFNKQTKVINKEIVVEEKFAFFLENSKKMALIRHVDKEVTLRRVLKKTQFNADAPEERIQNLKIRTRKAYTKEAEIKRKKLHRYERNLVSKYGITDFIEEPKEPEWEEEYLDEEQAGMDQEDLPDRHRDYRPQQGGQHQHQHQQSRPMGNNKKDYGRAQERYPARVDHDDGEQHYSDGVEDLNDRNRNRYRNSDSGSGSGPGSDVGSDDSAVGPNGSYDSDLDDDFDPTEVKARQEREKVAKRQANMEKQEIRVQRK